MGLVVLWATSALVYLGIAMAPGDEVTARLGPEVAATLSPADLQQMRINLGLNRPLPIRYAIWIGKVVHGDLGHSSTTDSTVIEALKTRIGATAMLIFFALFVGVVVGIFFGILAAVKENTWIDYLVGSVPILFIGIPSFIISLTAIYLVAIKMNLLPIGDMHEVGNESLLDLLKHMILPGSVLAISLAAPIIRYTRASMLDVLNSEFIVAARSKGLREGKVIVTHAFRNALIPIISIVGMFFPEVIAGAVITETIFRWPGMGQLAAKAASARDVTTVMGVVLAVATSVVIANLITDIAYTVADPRVRLG
jgi:peptide/nickel transport system permease protein